MQLTCKDCKQDILWENLCGIMLYTEDARGKIYRTRCGCGNIDRRMSGREATYVAPARSRS